MKARDKYYPWYLYIFYYWPGGETSTSLAICLKCMSLKTEASQEGECVMALLLRGSCHLVTRISPVSLPPREELEGTGSPMPETRTPSFSTEKKKGEAAHEGAASPRTGDWKWFASAEPSWLLLSRQEQLCCLAKLADTWVWEVDSHCHYISMPRYFILCLGMRSDFSKFITTSRSQQNSRSQSLSWCNCEQGIARTSQSFRYFSRRILCKWALADTRESTQVNTGERMRARNRVPWTGTPSPRG